MPPEKSHKVAPAELRVKIPSLLVATDAWIGHRAKKPLLLPYGQRAAKTNVKATWRPFADAHRFYEHTFPDPTAGIGFVFSREQGVVFIDFDHCLDAEGKVKPWAEPHLAPFRGKTFIERSLSGTGLHVLVLGSVERAIVGFIPPGASKELEEHIEIYNNLRFCAVTGDVFDSAPVTLTPMQAEVDAIVALVPSKSDGDGSAPADGLSPQQLTEREEEVRSALLLLDPDMTYEEWLRIGMAVHHGLGSRGFALWDEWSSRGSKYQKGECSERWETFQRSGITLGTLFHAANELGWKSPLHTPERDFKPITDEEMGPEPRLEDLTYGDGSFQEWAHGGYQLWQPNPKQEILVPCFNEANLHRFFTHHEDWGDRLRYNIRSQLPEIDGEVIDIHRTYRALAQSHAFLGWTKRAYSVGTVQHVIQAVAERHPFDPIAEWLKSLEWDGKRRLENLCETLGLEDTPITRRCLVRWLTGAVARAFRPGCKMQNMLLLLGPQGRYKSGLLERLASRPEWFHESHVELKNKEGYITLDRKWIVEFAELDGLRKVDIEKVKAFISDATQNYRAPYAKTAKDHPRHFVLAGTANEDRVLRDPTGARRFWPIRCSGTINLRELTPEVVRFLWAEARTLYENGVRWWDETSEVDEVNKRNTEFYAESVSDTMIIKVVEEEFAAHGALQMKQLIARLLELHIVQASTPENAIGAVLRRHEWVDQRVRLDDASSRRFWFAPTTPADKRPTAARALHVEWLKSTGAFTPEAKA